MAKRHREILARLDPMGLSRFQIAEKEAREVERYLNILQRHLPIETAWQEMVRYGGAYGTSIMIHEVVEIRGLRAKGIEPLHRSADRLRQLLLENLDAHVVATYEEHRYLQEVINRLYGQTFEVATLIKANRPDERDLQSFLESEVGVYLLEEHRINEARQALARLKGEAA